MSPSLSASSRPSDPPASKTKAELVEVTPDGRMRINFHPGQWRAWKSEKRWVAIIAGTQSGKTAFGPVWLYKQIQDKGPGDYLVATPTFTLLELKALPEFRRFFEQRLQLGTYTGSPVRRFVFSEQGSRRIFGSYDPANPTTVYFGYAEDPESLESSTMKAAWLDEAGQKKFKRGSWEAIQRRLSLNQGRALITTTPYDLGWIKAEFYDKHAAGDPDVDVIRFDSTENPAFPAEEFERARASLPSWKFSLYYKGIFERPAGLIYGSFDEDHCKVPRFTLPDSWPRYLGLDFGGVNTAGLFYAAEPGTGRYFLYREYKAGGRTAAEHARKLLEGEPMIPTCVGGSKSEGQWRDEFRAGGLPVMPPDVSEVEVGIDRVYGAHKANRIIVFDDLHGYLDQKSTYSRVLDANNEPTEKIQDKETYHYLDAERYVIGWLMRISLPNRIQRAKSPLNGYRG